MKKKLAALALLALGSLALVNTPKREIPLTQDYIDEIEQCNQLGLKTLAYKNRNVGIKQIEEMRARSLRNGLLWDRNDYQGSINKIEQAYQKAMEN